MSITTEIALDSIDGLVSRLPASGTVDVTIEVVGDDVGDQVEVQRLPWHTLIYDQASKVLELSIGARGESLPVRFRHEIHEPTRIWVEEDAGSVRALSIECQDGPQTIVRFHERHALEPSSS